MNELTIERGGGQASAPSQSSPLLRPFFPALDGLRAISFLLVFSFHYVRTLWEGTIWTWGWVGVDIFFVISGFLITGILYNSLERADYFRNFYTRRALRIFPLFYGFWLCILLLTPVLHVHWTKALATMPFYLGNFLIAGSHLNRHARPDLIVFTLAGGHHLGLLIDQFWTLCVEEQFYLVWPAVIFLVRSRRALLMLCSVLLVCLPLGRTAYLAFVPGASMAISAGALYFGTFSRADSLLAGALIALWLRDPSSARWQPRRWALAMLLGAPLLLATLLRFERTRPLSIFDPVVSTIGYSLIAIASAGLLLLAIEPDTPFTSTLEWRPLVFLGRISYGMYFFHELLFPEIVRLFPKLTALHLKWTVPVGVFVATLVVSSLSFRFFETPFLRLKSSLAPRVGAIDDPPPSRSIADITQDPLIER